MSHWNTKTETESSKKKGFIFLISGLVNPLEKANDKAKNSNQNGAS
jgi:hypothetical protein